MSSKAKLPCGCYIAILIFNLLIGGMSMDYLLEVFLSKNIPFLADCVIGLIVAEISVPVAIVTWILKAFNVF
jgi:hypothetical protein